MSEPAPALRAAYHLRDPERDGWPSVSVVVPVRNEGPHLERAVTSILDQDYPEPFDVCIAVAPSDDDTAEVAAAIVAGHQRVSFVDNPAGVTPAGLNRAIAATAGSIVVRVDGHAELSEGYIRQAVETMCRTGAVNVGGRQVPRPETPFEEAVAAATTSWLGTGGARYRIGGREGPVDTVYLGVFDRAAGKAVGWFDETLIRNQDYELNIRLRAAGGVVWFDPELSVRYRPRGTWRALARQYFEYGWWKAEVLRRNPGTMKARQAIVPAVIVSALVGTVVGVRFRPALSLPFIYVASVVPTARQSREPWRVAGVLATMHSFWTAGLVGHAVSLARSRR